MSSRTWRGFPACSTWQVGTGPVVRVAVTFEFSLDETECFLCFQPMSSYCLLAENSYIKMVSGVGICEHKGLG